MKDIDFMSEAFELAEEALEKGEVPVGCVFVKNGRIIERSYNDTNASGDVGYLFFLSHIDLGFEAL